MMGTRAAAFTGKISNLRDNMLRIQNGTLPQPSCIDLANMLKYFCQVLHDFRDFKDIEDIPLYASEKKDRLQLIKTLPDFDYCGLYKALIQLVDILPLIPQPSNGIDQLGANLLMLFKSLVPFLDQANMETMPYLVSTLFMSLPVSLHKDILDTLCFNLLPFTIDQQQRNQSINDIRKKKVEGSSEIKSRVAIPKVTTSKPMHCIVRIEDSTNQTRPPIRSVGDSLEDQGIEMMDEEPQVSRIGTKERRLSEHDDGSDESEFSDKLDEYASLSVTSILMIAFHYITEPMFHSQLVECLMRLKNNVFEDLLFVIAFGTTRARCPAVEILFRYWPDICPNQQDRKGNSQAKLKHIPWLPTKCQNKNCSFTTLDDDEAVKMCLDFKISITLSGFPPPMLICLDCVDTIYKQQLTNNDQDDNPDALSSKRIATNANIIEAIDNYSGKFIDLLLPMERISKLCENKKCKSMDRSAIGTCFDIECANYNGKRPMRYCKNCFISIHEPCESNSYDVTLQSHIRHSSIKLTIMDDQNSVNNFVEAIISLLKEAAPADRPSKDSERYLRSLMGPMSQFNNDNKDSNIATEEKQLISQYGIWLMTGLCKSVEKLSDELLGRLLGMLFQWFHFTACLPDDQAGSALEKLKGECIKGWIMSVKSKRMDVFISCLLPHPIDCSKIGGHWEVWPDTAHQIKEGFKRLLCLVPYDIITDDVWDEIMPHWMECFRHEVPENELSELKILLSKVFDPELSPLGFETKQMYHFISSRFEDSTNANQEQTLYWLQIITMLEIPIPIDFLFQMLKSGVKSLAEIRANELNRVKMNQRLDELERSHAKTRGHSRSSMPTSPSAGSTVSQDSSCDRSEALSAGSRTMSIPEDDVMLPTLKEGQVDDTSATDQQEVDKKPQQTQQERQALARAAFSAKLLQHATLLDAKHGFDNSLQAISQSKSATTQLGDVQQPLGSSEAKSLTLNAQGQVADNSTRLEPPSSHLHTQPLKSTSSSNSIAMKSVKYSDEHLPSTESKAISGKRDKGNQKPKLKLNMSPTEESLMHKIDNNLVCYILMLDILLKQLDLQEVSSHRGLDAKEPQQAIELLNAIISTPWLGRHTCCDSLPNSAGTRVCNSTSGDSMALNESASKIGHQATGSCSSAKHSNVEEEKTLPNIHLFSHCAEGFEHEDSLETCVFCEIISTFHQLAMSLIEFFSPLIEVSICEVSQDAANGEFDGKPDYSRIGLDHLGPSPKDLNVEFDFEQSTQESAQRHRHQGSDSPFSPSYSGPTLKPNVLNELPRELQLAYNLLVQFHQYQTPDIVSQLLQMIKLISLHSQVLSKASKNNPQFISWCQHNMLVNKLWSLCQLESSEIARTCVPLLLHCITLPWGVRLFRDLAERDFNSDQWLCRFRAVERVVTIAYFCEPSTIKNSTLLQSTMASAFCYVVRCLDDIEAIVAQRALVALEMMKTSSLKLLLWCLEVQFDCIVIDRPMILRSVFQLYNHLRDRRFLTWEFFLNRFDTIFLESQIYLQQTGEIPSFTMQDLKNTNTKSEIYQKKIVRAREALQKTHHSRSLSNRFNAKAGFVPLITKPQDDPTNLYKESLKMQQKMRHSSGRYSVVKNMSASLNVSSEIESKQDELGKKNIKPPLKRIMQHGESTNSRYQSIAYLTSQSLVNRKNSKFMSNLAMQSIPPMMLPDKLHQHLPNSFVDDGSKLNEIAQENHVFGVVHRVCDEDRDTTHSLVFLLMQFFSKPDSSHPQSVKTLNRNHQIVLRHLNILMGFSVARKNFLIAASNLRLLPVFNALLTSLPKVLDFNYSLGTILLDTCLPVLVYCPAPDDIQYDSLRKPNYSLWSLNPLMRQSWLLSVMTFLYKYQFNQPHLKDHVYMLVQIVINTLESHLNCATIDVSLDRCLKSFRDKQEHQQLHDQHEESANCPKAHLVSGSSSQHTTITSPHVQSTVTCDVGSKNMDQKYEVIEMKSPAELKKAQKSQLSSGLAISTSTGALRQAASSEQKTSSASSPKSLVKADTSDSLNVKSKIFQKKNADKELGTKNKPSSVTSLEKNLDQTIDQSKSIIELANPGDERLLPIGAPPNPNYKSSKSLFEQQPERLLPIGINKSNKVAQIVGSRVQVEVPKSQADSVSISDSTKESSKSTQIQDPVASVSATIKEQHPMGKSSKDLESEFSSAKNKKRFGVKQLNIESKQSNSKDHEPVGDTTKQIGPMMSPTVNISSMGTTKKVKSSKLATKEFMAKHPIATLSSSQSSSDALLSEQLVQINRHSPVQEFTDKDLSMCLVILETFIHHEPSMAAQMLPNILRLVARYSSASLDSWQSGSNVHQVGGSMFVARQFIRVALHDLMENNIFHQIFTSHFTGYEFYKSMATSLADFPDLNQLAPLSKLFEDLSKQKNLPEANTLITMLANVATYFECVISESSTHSQTTWNNFINNWENFLRKLILALPRYSGSSVNPNAPVISGARNSETIGSLPNSNVCSGLMLGGQNNANSSSAAPNQFGGIRGTGVSNQDNSTIATRNALQSSCSLIMMPIMRIILSTTKISHLSSCKTIVDPYSKIISYTVLNSSFNYEHLLEINHNCCRLYTRDRDKYLIQRTIAYELSQVLKFRFFILEENLLKLLLFILQDVGGTLAPKVVKDGLKIDQATLSQAESYITNVSECLRQYISDLLDFITDVHSISRINDNLIGSQPSSINRDSFGGHVKAAISQYLALEISLNSGADNRTISRYLPRLYSSPSLQQGPREFIDCISHIRQLSWIILGSLQHSTLMKRNNLSSNQTNSSSSQNTCQPIPIEKNGNIAEHVQVILAGFAEQSKESVTHMSGLFHAFLLCQLWTMYCENICNQHSAFSEQYQFCQSTLDDFWAKITPGVLRLVGHSRVMSEMVGTHFLQLIESLIESNSSILVRYLPMWNSVFYSYKKRNKSGNLAIRLQKCIEWQPPDFNEQDIDHNNKRFLNWLEKVQYKMSHIEIQSSQAAPFYFT